jgi:hypothetical protein
VLYDDHGAYYAGLARGASGIGGRLKNHRTDEHGGRWQRFSWYSFDAVSKRHERGTGLHTVARREKPVPASDEAVIRELEALLITVLGTRGQRRMKFQSADQWDQVGTDASARSATLSCIRPRQENDMPDDPTSLVFFHDFARTPDAPTCADVLATLTSDRAGLTRQIGRQLHANAHVASCKYRWSTSAIRALGSTWSPWRGLPSSRRIRLDRGRGSHRFELGLAGHGDRRRLTFRCFVASPQGVAGWTWLSAARRRVRR